MPIAPFRMMNGVHDFVQRFHCQRQAEQNVRQARAEAIGVESLASAHEQAIRSLCYFYVVLVGPARQKIVLQIERSHRGDVGQGVERTRAVL